MIIGRLNMMNKFLLQDKVLLNDFLNEDYPEISKAIKKEGYTLDFLDYDIFHEIKYEDQIVGFMTFKKFLFTNNDYELREAYIIPEYRGNNLFFESFLSFLTFDNFDFYPRKPTKSFIKVLLKNDFAFEIAPNFVVSYFKFIVDVDYDLYKNPKIKKFYKKADIPLPYKANLFDMDLCNVMFVDPELDIVKYQNFFALTEPRKYDLKRYNCRKKLKRVSEKYIDKKYSIWEDNYENIEDFIQRSDDELDNLFLFENIVGSEDELNEDFVQKLEENNLSIDDGFKIRKHLIKKLECGELNEMSYFKRITYLLDHFEAIDNQIDKFDESVEECPFCGTFIPDYVRSCLECGLHIREIDFEQHSMEMLKENLEETINNLSDLVNSNPFEEDLVKIEDDDETDIKELKKFYNEFMVEYEYDKFLDFYNSCDKNLSIEQVRDLFAEEELGKVLGTEKEFTSYLNYLLHYLYYYKDTGKYDEAFIKLIQLAILVSNKSKNKKKILESNPHSIDVFYAIEEMEAIDYSFNLVKLFDEAVNTFKITKYNNNHEEVLKELKEIF